MVNVLSKIKYIKVSEETHQALTDMGGKGDSYNDIIWRLIKHIETVDLEMRLLLGDPELLINKEAEKK